MTAIKESSTIHGGTALRERSEFEIAQKLESRRLDLMKDADLADQSPNHFKRPVERDFTRSQRGQVTLLFGGLTNCHDALVKAATQGLGYKVDTIPTAVKADFQAGKEYGNNGQCNPTYFTVGALVNYLKDLRDLQGQSTEDILQDYAFVTAGACGPCRFGMYEAEFRLALRNSGFDGFRVMLFQQQGGMEQSAEGAGLDLNIDFGLALLNGIVIADVLNEVAYQLRPYEVHEGDTDRVMGKAVARMQECLRAKDFAKDQHSSLVRFTGLLSSPLGKRNEIEKLLSQLGSAHYTSALQECREMLDNELEVDFTRPKPVCKVTGEFWAQTTEGDGNFNMFRFLESQGAEVLVEPITTWINYLIAQARTKQEDIQGLGAGTGVFAKLKSNFDCRKTQFLLDTAKSILNREYDRIRKAMGGTTHEQVCQLELQRMGHPFYNRKAGGGEGHLEVAKNIYYASKGLAHMVISLKPFGCMPSTQSDGAQAAVIANYSDMVYIPIETSGEGDVNAHSRAQMALGEAKVKCKAEFQRAVAKTGYTVEQIREYCRHRPELKKPLQLIPHNEGIAGRAANFVLYAGKLMDSDSSRR